MELLQAVIYWAVTATGALFAAGTLLSFTSWSHWFVRGWDFPRVQIGAVLAVSGSIHALLSERSWYNVLFLAVVGGCTAWQLYKMYPYTPLAGEEVRDASDLDATRSPVLGGAAPLDSLRLVASNVQMENEQYDRWLEVVRAADPDVILALEVDERWMEHIDVLEQDYPHVVARPQENYYGMAVFSRLELVDPQVQFIVDEEVPSIHTGLTLKGRQQIYFHGMHPRPPEPLRGTSSVQRDAEIVVMGREIRDADEESAWSRPTVIAGDFNDVAWSRTTELFMRLSGLLDPRKGRGFLDTFDANSRWFRFPVDHIFHSDEFALVDMHRLDYVGSDHFPICVELCYAPAAHTAVPTPKTGARDDADADEAIDRAEAGGNRVNRDPI